MIKNRMSTLVGICTLCILVMISCQKEPPRNSDYSASEYAELSKVLDLPQEVYDYSITMPGDVVVFGPDFAHIGQSNHQATLGRVIFYDELLSRNGTVSCGSCHIQSAGFADNKAGSEGFDGGVTPRNSLALGTAAVGLTNSYNGGFGKPDAIAKFSWDDSVHDMNQQTQNAIENPLEMGMTMESMVERLKSIAYYDILFNKAFGEDAINEENTLQAVSHFVNSITTNRSEFDRAMETAFADPFTDFPEFSAKENLGKELYLQNCASCHSAVHDFTVKAVGNNGLVMEYEDQGVGAVTNEPSDRGVFKIPFLRNIELSAPYMHDGSFATLEEVIDHYSDGIVSHPNLSEELKGTDGQAKRMNFSDNEKGALVAYLRTLTDYEMVADDRFSDPFRQ